MRVLAVDWSGDAHRARSRMWLAEAISAGRLVRLECGRDRAAMADHLLRLEDVAIVGLDFAFSFPSWFFGQLGVSSAVELWAHVAEQGEGWLHACAYPFWGRQGFPKPNIDSRLLRRTEVAVPRHGGIAPKSIFQIGGAGSVGTGSIRGVPLLHRLNLSGARIWPYTDSGAPTIVEIYPRLLTGPVRKSSATHRAEFLALRYPTLDSEHARRATDSEDAFDAAVSALVMVEHVADLAALPIERDPDLRLEGRIWHPAWRSDPL